MKVVFKGFNYSQDGPGNRLVYHLQGCNMRCPWCSTPEAISVNGCMITDSTPRDEDCPNGAIRNGILDRTVCEDCYNKPCLDIPGSGLRLSCSETDINTLFNDICCCTPLFFESGGVTFTGGEATLQFKELSGLLEKLKDAGIHTALETNGSHPFLPKLFDLIDYLIIDCKHYDNEKHLRVVGTSNKEVLKNISVASASRKQLLVRIPLVNNFNASSGDAKKFLKFFSTLDKDVCDFELLRYHEFAKEKWAKCGLEYNVKDGFVDDNSYSAFAKILSDGGLNLIST